MAFLGMGGPNADGANYGEPLTGSDIMMVLRADDLGNGGNLKARDNNVGESTSIYDNIGLTVGTHGMRMDWNATTSQATFLFDLGNDGTYDPALTFVVNGSDNGFSGSNSQLFVGGGNGLTIDNISVTSPVPEPSSALLGALGFFILGALRRR